MYTLELDSHDIQTINAVGNRHAWSAKLQDMHVTEGENWIPEHEAWEVYDACESDTTGNHDYFPLLNPNSFLCEKLTYFLYRIV